MAKAPRSGGGPSGALEAAELQQWLEGARSQLGATGITANFGRAPRIGGVHGPTWVTMTSASAHGRLVRSADGVTTVTAHSLPSSATLLDQRHPHTTLAQLDALVVALGGIPTPTAGRA